MPHEVIMPALGMAQDSGLIVAWHKSPGDEVSEGEVLFEVETDKATMEVEAQGAGFLTDVAAAAGSEVPVGNVIARISESPQADAKAPAPAPANGPQEAPDTDTDSLPEGQAVIMPTLGMAQDAGLLVSWQKAPGEAVAADDVLFEVETDKSTVEVPAGFDGYIAAQLAEAGEEVPVGVTIAIISKEKPESPVVRSAAAAPEASDAPAAPPPEAPAAEKAEAPAAKAPAAPPSAEGRILASPKARRLALEQGLDLERLAKAGHPQPFHVKDLETLKALPAEAPAAAAAATAAARRLTADLPAEGFTAFAAWAAEHAGIKDAGVLLAGLAGASLDASDAVVAVESAGRRALYAVPRGPIGAVEQAGADHTPDLILRDLRLSRISAVQMGAEDAPVLTIAAAGAGLSLTLECAGHQLSASAALSLLSEFAGRMEQPLRHLL